MSSDRPQILHIAMAGNVFVPAYLVLRDKGYTVTREESAEGEEVWLADGPLGKFDADNTVSLLGLVAMAETVAKTARHRTKTSMHF